MTNLRRRDFLRTASTFALFHGARGFSWAFGPKPQTHPVIDAHIHLFDPTRPGGVPWPEKDDVIYQPALPPRYESLAKPFGVVGAIAVECSPLVEDNDWLLEVAAKYPIIVGVIGNLDPANLDFPKQLERLGANPLFRGIRYGNLWGRDLGAQLTNPGFVANLKRLAASGLLLEGANPDPALIADILRVTDLVPDLRIVIDHLPQALPPASPAARKSYERDLQAVSRRGNVFVKGSEVLRRVDRGVPSDVDFYRPWLDEIWETFGEDRLLFGSDWPNSNHLAPYADTFDIIRRYMAGKGDQSSAKFFWKNSINIYRWHQRTAAQANLTASSQD